MSRVFDALRQFGTEGTNPLSELTDIKAPEELFPKFEDEVHERGLFKGAHAITLKPTQEGRVVALTDRYCLAAERFRLLALRIHQLQEKRPLKRLLITSSVVQEGKSLMSANLALTYAIHEKQRVLLIEGDLRQPKLVNILGTGRLAGLSEWSHGNRSITEFVYRVDQTNLWFLPSGYQGDHPLEILNSDRLHDAMTELSGWFDLIVIDTPPVVAVADTKVWENFADATLMVVRAGKTPKRLLKKALETLNRSKLIGAVVNEVSMSPQYASYRYLDNAPGGKRQTKGRSAGDPLI